MTVPNDLHWDEPDAGCVSCGQPFVTISDHRCADCLGEPVRYCQHCLEAIAPTIDRETVRRVRETSWEVSEGFVERGLLRRITAAHRAVQARRRSA